MPNSTTETKTEMQIGDDPAQNILEWKIQRVFWTLATAILIGACAGVFGNSLFLKEEKEMGGVRVEYPRFSRVGSKGQLVIHFQQTKGETERVFFSRDVLKSLDVDKITPEPSTTELSDGGISYIFKAHKRTRPGAQPSEQSIEQSSEQPGTTGGATAAAVGGVKDTQVTFALKPEKMGSVRGELRVSGETFTLHQFVYP